MVVVVVEPGLADGHDARCVEQVDDRVDALDGVVRVQPDGGVDARMVGGDGDRGERGLPVAADGDQGGDALGDRCGDGAVGAVGNPRVMDVAVRIGPDHHRRGKRESPLVTVAPGT